jgi:hypothetical protein
MPANPRNATELVVDAPPPPWAVGVPGAPLGVAAPESEGGTPEPEGTPGGSVGLLGPDAEPDDVDEALRIASEDKAETSDEDAELMAEESEIASEVGLFLVIDSIGGVMLMEVFVVVCT